MKEAGKTRGEVAEFLVNDIKKARRQGYTLRDIRDLLADAGVSVPLARLQGLRNRSLYWTRKRREKARLTPVAREKRGSKKARMGNDPKGSGAVKVHTLTAPLWGMGQMPHS